MLGVTIQTAHAQNALKIQNIDYAHSLWVSSFCSFSDGFGQVQGQSTYKCAYEILCEHFWHLPKESNNKYQNGKVHSDTAKYLTKHELRY